MNVLWHALGCCEAGVLCFCLHERLGLLFSSFLCS